MCCPMDQAGGQLPASSASLRSDGCSSPCPAATDRTACATDLIWVVTGAVFGTALGALRGATVQLVDKGGVLWQGYTGRTFLAVIGTLALTAGFGVLAVQIGMHENARPLQLPLGVSFLGESLMVGRRGMVSGIPFAPKRTH